MAVVTNHLWAMVLADGVFKTETMLAEKIDRRGDEECWHFTGQIGDKGYGCIWLAGKMVIAHRLAWTLANKTEPGSLLVCHSCDVRSCCNPAHLFLGTPKDNFDDMVAKGRHHPPPGKAGADTGTLTDRQRAEICCDPRPPVQIVEAYGISLAHVYRLRNGRTSGSSCAQIPAAAFPLSSAVGSRAAADLGGPASIVRTSHDALDSEKEQQRVG